MRRPAVLHASLVSLVSFALACGGAAAPTKQETTPSSAAPVASAAPATDAPASSEASGAPASDPVAEAPGSAPASGEPAPIAAPAGELGSLPVDAPLSSEVNAGVIPRSELAAVLARGIPRFLADVRVERLMISGQFTGWRILSMFAKRPEVNVLVLRPGDTVRRANGQSIERPEGFQAVWNGMATANELVLDIDRAGRASKLRYTISD